ncbi:MAG: hypothetical protein AAGG81_00905 [Chlamydiota bacterium]
MIKHLLFLSLFCFALTNSSFALVGGAGLEFEELIPRDSFDPDTIETLDGQVTEILNVPKMTGMGNATVLRFGGPSDSIYIILGPDWYLKKQSYEADVGDLLTVRGSKIQYKDKTVVIASEIISGENILHLRNEKTGSPEWSEWRKGEEIFYKNYKW